MEHLEISLPSGAHTRVTVRIPDNHPTRALILFHGRGASAADILRLSDNLDTRETVVLAPDAPTRSWYPHRFLVPQAENMPELSHALEVAEELVRVCGRGFGIAPEKIVIGGFSQGACLTAEYISRSAHRFAGACIMSGGLIGTDEEVRNLDRSKQIEGMPIYIGCDEADPHIPLARVEETSDLLKKLGATVTTRIYSDLGHSVHVDAVFFMQELLSGLEAH